MNMEVRNEQKNVVLVSCPPKPEIDEKLEALIIVMRKETTNLVVDFSGVDIITASNISMLLILRKLLEDKGHKLILSGISSKIKNLFVITELHQTFEFIEDKSTALTTFNVA